MKDFNIRIENLELRSCDENLVKWKEGTTAAIVKWYKKGSCIVIAYWVKDKESYDLKFCWDRPLEYDVDWDDFKRLIKIGYKLLMWEENEDVEY